MPTNKEKPATGKPARKPTATAKQPEADKDQLNETINDFERLVNMGRGEIEKWLKTEESKSVGQDSGDGTSVGAKSGAKITKLLGKGRTKLTAADLEHMKKVIGYISRHAAQGPAKTDKQTSPWRY